MFWLSKPSYWTQAAGDADRHPAPYQAAFGPFRSGSSRLYVRLNASPRLYATTRRWLGKDLSGASSACLTRACPAWRGLGRPARGLK